MISPLESQVLQALNAKRGAIGDNHQDDRSPQPDVDQLERRAFVMGLGMIIVGAT